MTSLSDAGAVLSAERNLVHAFKAFASDTPGAQFHEDADLCWTLTHYKIPVLNSVFAARLDADNAGDAIEAAKQRAAERDVPLLWWVLPGNTPADLGTRLAHAGFSYLEKSPIMSLDLTSQPAATAGDGVDGVRVAAIASEADARAWCSVLCSAFEFGRPFYDAYLPATLAVAANPHRPLRDYALWWNDEMVATVSIAVLDGVGGIYNVATLPKARRKGFGAAITAYAAREARALGASTAVLEASQAGFTVYRGLGFTVRGELEQYTWPAYQRTHP